MYLCFVILSLLELVSANNVAVLRSRTRGHFFRPKCVSKIKTLKSSKIVNIMLLNPLRKLQTNIFSQERDFHKLKLVTTSSPCFITGKCTWIVNKEGKYILYIKI